MSSLRVRYSLQYVQYLYDSGEDRSKLENLIRAFRGIQALPPDNTNSFSYLGGLHGLPFRGPGEKDPNWWGGYCWHATVLFPTWHRIYLLRLEDALRSIPDCHDVTLPFWDELANLPDPSVRKTTTLPFPPVPLTPIPTVLTSPTFELDGKIVDNPLYSYRLQQALVENVDGANHRYSKPAGYQTVRYPLSGLVGTEEDVKETTVHNAKFPDPVQNVAILNNNVTEWLLGTVKIADDGHGTPQPDTYSIYARFLRCLLAPNYTVFSNTAAQNQWIKDHGQEPSSHYVVALESPHNAIHLSLGGFYQQGVYNADAILGANGDMGDNETAGFDPIFFLHHCFIDYTFHVWQKLWGHTKRGSLNIIKDYPGTILQEGQPPNFEPGYHITLDTTPLIPFEKPGPVGGFYTSDDATDLNELGIAYGPGSLDHLLPKPGVSHRQSPYELIIPKFPTMVAGSNPNEASPFRLTKWVHNINRADYEGSFVIRLYAQGEDDKEVEVGREPILSRWSVSNCRNCQSHLDVDLYVPIHDKTLQYLGGGDIKYRIAIQARDKIHDFTPVLSGGDEAGPQVHDL